MAILRGLLRRARTYAESVVPDDVRQAGRRLGERVRESAPTPIAAALDRIAAAIVPHDEVTRDAPADPPPEASASPTSAAPPPAPSPEPMPTLGVDAPVVDVAAEPESEERASASMDQAAGHEPDADGFDRESPEAVLRRVKARAEAGLKPEDTLVVVYATQAEAAAVDEIVAMFDGIETTIRVMDLDREPPQTKRQLAGLTDVMVPPYVYINGRHWGGQYEIAALAATGDLPAVVANRIDEIGPEARRIGKLHATFSDAITVDNILERWRLGHILCVDDLDAWFEVDKDGVERFFAEGGPQDVARMPELAREIARRVEDGEIEAVWRLDTVVHLH